MYYQILNFGKKYVSLEDIDLQSIQSLVSGLFWQSHIWQCALGSED